MNWYLYAAFLSTTLLFVFVPGPSVAFASAQAVRHGARAALVTVAGDALGSAVHIAIVVLGLATLMSLSEIVLPILQIAGGLFIIGMGLRALRPAPKGAPAPAVNHRVSFWAGFFACVTNPKAIVFFVAFFPTFISPDHPVLLQSLVLGVTFILLDAASILAYALLALHAVRRVTHRWLSVERLSAMGLLGVGAGMVIKGYRAIPSN